LASVRLSVRLPCGFTRLNGQMLCFGRRLLGLGDQRNVVLVGSPNFSHGFDAAFAKLLWQLVLTIAVSCRRLDFYLKLHAGCNQETKRALTNTKLPVLLLPYDYASLGPLYIISFVLRRHRMHEMLTIVTDVRGACPSVSLPITNAPKDPAQRN